MKLDYDKAASLLSQLGNTTRLKIVRELVKAGNAGKPVGEIRDVLDIPNSTLSHHLNHLKNAGLIRQEREKPFCAASSITAISMELSLF